jgi:hypothetical protein
VPVLPIYVVVLSGVLAMKSNGLLTKLLKYPPYGPHHIIRERTPINDLKLGCRYIPVVTIDSGK